MVAGTSILCVSAAAGSAAQVRCSRSPFVSTFEKSPSQVRIASLSRLTCSSSLVASERPPREGADFTKMESAFSSLVLNVVDPFEQGKAERSSGLETISRAPWHILETGGEDKQDRKQGGAFSAPLVWRDASLRYANVMWFKGAYNVEIICGEDEPEEAIVRRFRQAVSRAGVIRECQRRRYRETPQDTIKRKQRTASFNRKRSRQTSNSGNAWTQNAWKLSRDHLKPVDHNKKKKSARKNFGPPRFDATKKGSSDQKPDDIDDDYWGYVEEVEEPHRSKH